MKEYLEINLFQFTLNWIWCKIKSKKTTNS